MKNCEERNKNKSFRNILKNIIHISEFLKIKETQINFLTICKIGSRNWKRKEKKNNLRKKKSSTRNTPLSLQ